MSGGGRLKKPSREIELVKSAKSRKFIASGMSDSKNMTTHKVKAAKAFQCEEPSKSKKRIRESSNCELVNSAKSRKLVASRMSESKNMTPHKTSWFAETFDGYRFLG